MVSLFLSIFDATLLSVGTASGILCFFDSIRMIMKPSSTLVTFGLNRIGFPLIMLATIGCQVLIVMSRSDIYKNELLDKCEFYCHKWYGSQTRNPYSAEFSPQELETWNQLQQRHPFSFRSIILFWQQGKCPDFLLGELGLRMVQCFSADKISGCQDYIWAVRIYDMCCVRVG